MPPNFHLFPYLPAELRLLIWDAAIRDKSVAGVQYFNLVDCFDDKLLSQCPCIRELRPHIPTPTASTGHSAGAELGLSATRSAYIIDSGLWGACKESRYVMQHHFLRENIPRLWGCDLGPNHSRLHMTVASTNGASDTRHYTFSPLKDVIVLSYFSVRSEVAIRGGRVKLAANRYICDLRALRHFGIEYNPRTLPGGHDVGIFVDDLMKLALFLRRNRTIYLIDHDLRRRRGLGVSEEHVKNTFSAHGGRYVDIGDSEEWGYDNNIPVEWLTPHLAVRMLRRKIQAFRPGALDWSPPVRVAILAWESK